MAMYVCDFCNTMQDDDHSPSTDIGEYDMVCEICQPECQWEHELKVIWEKNDGKVT